jgi:hypothetical protein
MRSFNGTASAILFWALGALALTGCAGEVSDPSTGAGAVGEARAADDSQTSGPGVPWGPNGATTTDATPTAQAPVPTTDQGSVATTPAAPASTCSCGQTAAAPDQGVAPPPDQGVAPPPDQGAAPPPDQGAAPPPDQGAAPPQQGGAPIQGGIPIGGGVGGIVGGIPIIPLLPPPPCCCAFPTFLDAYFAGWPLCMRVP